jgi:predicted amidophosphoribosyltransferase
LFPLRCAGCGRGAWPFCERCHRELEPIVRPWCTRCGRPTEADVDGCAWCPPPPVSVARAPFLFRGPARAAIHRLKFSGWRAVAEALGDAMMACADLVPELVQVDALCWAPVSRRRFARRGYDQAEALATVIGRRMGMSPRSLLRRVRDPGPQARRGGAERRAAMAGCFRAAGVVPERVLLVDDVLTTGATAAACAAELSKAGVVRIRLLTAARAFPGRLPARYTRGLGARPGLWLPGGSSPEVDASRGRNDPRKATLVAEHGAV